MKKMILFFMLLTLLLVGCVSSSGGNAPGAPTDREVFIKGYEQATSLEILASNHHDAMWFEVDVQTNAALSGNQLAEQCFDNTYEIMVDAGMGRYDDQNGQTDEGALIDALVVNEAFSGDPSICQQMKAQIQRDIMAVALNQSSNRAKLLAYRLELQEAYGVLKPFTGLAFSLLTEWMGEVEERLPERLPLSDAVYPTFHLQAQTFSRDVCEYYNGIYNGAAVTGRCDWNPALNQGTLHGQAAWEYIFALRLSDRTQSILDGGSNNPVDFGTDD